MFIQPIRTQETFKNPKSGVDFHFYYKNFFGLHSHDFYEFMIMTKGKTLHKIDQESEIVQKNTVVLIRPNEMHQAFPYQNEKSEHLTISIAKESFQELCNTFSHSLFKHINENETPISFSLNDNEFDYILYLANKLNTMSPTEFAKDSIKTSKLIILNLLLKLEHINSAPKTIPEWLNSFLQILSLPENFNRPLKELYNLAPYSQTLLNRYFHQYVGKTIIAHITDLKINYACNLLKNTNYSILHISGLLGYESLAHFNRTFKRIAGCTPASYRKTLEKQ